jgi:hypothetical protein
MGSLVYGAQAAETAVDDRTLAHLQVVITAKLRRNETFILTLEGGGDLGRRVLWIAPAIPLMFWYDGSGPPALNKHWLEDMIVHANTMAGLIVSPEPSHTENHTESPEAHDLVF